MLTRVLVLLLLKVIATVLPVNAPTNDAGTEPDLTALLWLSALRTRLVSSVELRSWNSISVYLFQFWREACYSDGEQMARGERRSWRRSR